MTDWEVILQHEGPAVWRTLWRLLGNRADADDCFQETFLAALQFSRAQSVLHWSALLARFATARAVDRLRVRYRLRDAMGESAGDADVDAAMSRRPGPVELAAASELSDQLRKALARLPGEQAEIFALHALSGWSYDEIGRQLGMSSSNVGVTLHRARHRLGELLGQFARSEQKIGENVMNGNLSKDNADDLLARSLNAMRNAPIPDGPSQEVLADTLAALGSAADLSGSLKIKRFTSMKFITRFAASILLACGLAAIAFVSFHPSIALADVVKKVRDARSVTFFTSMTIPGAKDQVGRIKVIVDNAGHTRVEHADGMTVTLDMISGKALMLVPKTKTAVTMTFKTAGAMNLDPSTPNGPSGLMIDPIQEFKKLAGKPSKDLGEKTIDGKNAKGFIVTQDGHDITVWADAKTGDPVRMEIGLPFMGQQATVVVNDFVFDAPIDAGLFSLAVPKDYQLTEMQVPNINKDGEKVVIEALKGFAERSGGQFPNRLDDWSEFTKLVKSDPENPSKLDAATTQWMGSIGAMTPFLLSLPGDSHAYLGKGVTLNQKDAIIFWYRNAESGKCRAIYADLTVKDADPKTLPKAPPAEARPSLPPTPVPATSAIKRVAPPATAAPIRATPKEVAPK